MTTSDKGRSAGLSQAGIELPVPNGWRDESVLCFVAPQQEKRVGMLLKHNTQQVQTSYTVCWEAAAAMDTATLRRQRPVPQTVMNLKEAVLSECPPTIERTYRYRDPLLGMVVQQSQTLVNRDGRLYVLTLTADPLNFAARRQEILESRRAL